MTTTHRPAARRATAGLGVLALGLGATLVTVAPAQAAEQIDDVTLTWQLNDETGGGAFFGGCNFLSAGTAGDTGSSRLWTAADDFYASQAGNVTIVKPNADGDLVQPTWATKCQTPAGTNVTTAAGSTSGNRVQIEGGTGTVDTAAGTASVSWDGSFTVVFYGGMTYWTVSDPTLEVAADGTAQLVGTGSGYGSDMNDTGKWVELAPQEIVLADLTGVEVDSDGFTVTPEYAGVEVDLDGGTPQSQNGDSWGSFPQSFVDFNVLTGQSSYWYSSGGAADPKKTTEPLSVEWTVDDAPVWNPAVQVSQTEDFDPTKTTTVTVTGSGFDPLANVNAAGRPPVAANQPSGVYVVFGKFAENWRPSADADRDARTVVSQKWALPEPSYTQVKNDFPNVANQLVLMNEDGSFSADLEVAVSDEGSGSYGIYTFAAGGAVANAAHELATPIAFGAANGSGEGDVDVDVEVPEKEDPVDPGAFSWTINGTGAVSLGTAEQGEAAFTANGTLHAVTVSDTRPEGTWTINGQVGSFVGGSSSFSGAALGWAPQLTSGDALVGNAVAAGSNPGLTATSALASGTGANGKADAVLGADLTLSIPLDTPAGDYSGVLTLTAVG